VFVDRFLARKSTKGAARRLYDEAVAQGRRPALYARLGAPDTVEGRFEILTLHVILLIDRLRAEGAAAAQLRQALFDVYVGDLDGALREMSVGDLAVGKRMKALGGAFYGRARAYEAAFQRLPDLAMIEEVVARTILDGVDAADPAPLAAYLTRRRESLAACETATLLKGRAGWPVS
jgi:cytochrome b pre-mRNA-processing protein 3